MEVESKPRQRIALDVGQPIWNQFFTVCPLILVGTRESNGQLDLAPKHMAMPMGWENYFGFVCTPSHGTFKNIERTGEFTVSFPRPSQLLYTSLAASPRYEGEKPVLGSFATFDASVVDGAFFQDSYLFLECKHHKTIDGFGNNSLIAGRIVAAQVDREALRVSDGDDQALLQASPLLTFLQPNRFAVISESSAFPYPEGMQK